MSTLEKAYEIAKQQYAEIGVDTDRALERLAGIPISLHCWQGDDVGGFENSGDELGGGLAVTGNYPGKARTADELRADLEHGAVADSRQASPEPARLLCRDGRQEGRARRARAASTSSGWIDWAKAKRLGDGFQPDLLRASASGRRLHAGPSATQGSASSGSSTASPAARSARRSARRWARRA